MSRRSDYPGTSVARTAALPTCALNAESAQQAFELRHTCSDALEVLIGEREELHWRTRHDCGRPLSRQEECDLTERVAGTESFGRLVTVGQQPTVYCQR